MIGEFEYVLLTAASALGDDAYGVSIREQIESATGRRCSIGALYTTIDRLESKGFVTTWLGGATTERGGRSKRMVQLTPQGVSAAREFYNAIMRVSRDASWAVERGKGIV